MVGGGWSGTSSRIVILTIKIPYVGPSHTVQRTSKPPTSPLIFPSKPPQLHSLQMELPTMASIPICQHPVRRLYRWLHSSPWKNNIDRLDLANVSCTTFQTMKVTQLVRRQQSELVGLQQSELARLGNVNLSDAAI